MKWNINELNFNELSSGILTKGQRKGYYEKWHREQLIYKCMKFILYNRIEGDYLEFGCHSGTTFKLARKYARLFDLKMHLYAFDSFQGLPKPKGIDVHAQWEEGAMANSINEFKKILEAAKIKEDEYTLVPGFYSESLSMDAMEKLKIRKAAFVYVDCDLYESTVPVLNFILPLLQTGTIIAFDDFFCFNGDPDCGEQLAIREFLKQNPEIELVDYITYGWHGKSFIIKKRAPVKRS